MTKIYRVQMNSKGMPNFSTAVEIEDRPQGEWFVYDGDDDLYVDIKCSYCRKAYTIDSYKRDDIGFTIEDLKFCPNCGARMKGADDYERAIEQMEHDMLYEPTYNSEDGSM